jgi:hypothetical protein
MMKSPLLARVSRVSCGLSIAILALAFTSSVSTVRAQTDVPSWMLADPISDAVKALEERLTSLEAKVASVSESITSRPSAEHQLCVADDAGNRTCIDKAQLDRLLRMMQAAAIEPPAQVADSVTTSVAATAPAPAEPVEAVASAPETKASEEPSRIETTDATIVEAPPQDAQAAQAALAQETLDQDSMPTGSVPASAESDGRALVIHPEVEITTPPTEH